MQIKSFSGYHEDHKALYRTLFKMTKPVGTIYNDYDIWYRKTFMPGLRKNERGYVLAMEERGKVVGCALLKKTPNEKKICTLFVNADWRRRGVGTELMKETLKVLGPHPLMTVSHQNIAQFKPLLQRFGFKLSAKKQEGNRIEYHFNDPKAEAIKHGLIPVLIQRMKQLGRK